MVKTSSYQKDFALFPGADFADAGGSRIEQSLLMSYLYTPYGETPSEIFQLHQKIKTLSIFNKHVYNDRNENKNKRIIDLKTENLLFQGPLTSLSLSWQVVDKVFSVDLRKTWTFVGDIY